MKISIFFPFKELPAEVREEIFAENEIPQHVYVTYRGSRLSFPDRHVLGGAITPTEETRIEFDVWEEDEDCELPKWLQKVNCRIKFEETFFGYIPNGKFRYGAVKATVNSFMMRLDAFDTEVEEGYQSQECAVATKITIKGSAQAKTLLKSTFKLYESIRSHRIDQKNVMVLFPVQVPGSLVTVGDKLVEA